MTWRVFLTDSSQPDLDRLTPEDRAALTDELFAWVSDGPPRTSGQVVAGVQLFEDQLPSGIGVTYFVDEQVPYVGVVRVRRDVYTRTTRRSGSSTRRSSGLDVATC